MVILCPDQIILRQNRKCQGGEFRIDRKSTRLNSSHVRISYAVFCLKKKKTKDTTVPSSVTGSYSRSTRATFSSDPLTHSTLSSLHALTCSAGLPSLSHDKIVHAGVR